MTKTSEMDGVAGTARGCRCRGLPDVLLLDGKARFQVRGRFHPGDESKSAVVNIPNDATTKAPIIMCNYWLVPESRRWAQLLTLCCGAYLSRSVNHVLGGTFRPQLWVHFRSWSLLWSCGAVNVKQGFIWRSRGLNRLLEVYLYSTE